MLKKLAEILLKPSQPPVDPGYVITKGENKKFIMNTPCSIEFDIEGLWPGGPDDEKVTVWAVESGEDWKGGNPDKGVFAIRCHDSRPTWQKMKVYGDNPDGYIGEPKMDMAWDKNDKFHFKVEIIRNITFLDGTVQGTVSWTVTRLSDNRVSPPCRVTCRIPPVVDMFIGDPITRKCAEGAKITNIKAEGALA